MVGHSTHATISFRLLNLEQFGVLQLDVMWFSFRSQKYFTLKKPEEISFRYESRRVLNERSVKLHECLHIRSNTLQTQSPRLIEVNSMLRENWFYQLSW